MTPDPATTRPPGAALADDAEALADGRWWERATGPCRPGPQAGPGAAGSVAGSARSDEPPPGAVEPPVVALAIEGYSEVAPIGRGGLGDVFRAVRRSTGATVAIKVLRPAPTRSGEAAPDPIAWHRLRRELTALVALGGHAHVVAVSEVLDLPIGPALVMEYAPGGSVADLVAARGAPLSVPEVALVARHTAAALGAAGDRGIVHRDVKPHNLLIDGFGQVKLCDFGVAALHRSAEFRARTNAVSLRYASPEDLEDDGDVGPPSDIYSLGATLLYVAHGVHLELRDRLTPWQPAPEPGIPEPGRAALDALIAWCLQPQPSQRPSASEVLDAVDRIEAELPQRCRGLPVRAPAPTSEPAPAAAFTFARPVARDRPPPRRRADEARSRPTGGRRRRRLVTRAALGSAVVAGAGLVWWLGPPATADPSAAVPSASTVVPTVVARPAGLVGLTATAWPAGPVGECLVQRPGRSVLEPVDCALPHDLERIAVGSLGDPDPTAVAARCTAAAARHIGRSPGAGDPAGLAVSSTRPSEAGWAAGDRTYQCWLGVPGQRLVGTVRAVPP